MLMLKSPFWPLILVSEVSEVTLRFGGSLGGLRAMMCESQRYKAKFTEGSGAQGEIGGR